MLVWFFSTYLQSCENQHSDNPEPTTLKPCKIRLGCLFYKMSPSVELWVFDLKIGRTFVTQEIGRTFDPRNL